MFPKDVAKVPCVRARVVKHVTHTTHFSNKRQCLGIVRCELPMSLMIEFWFCAGASDFFYALAPCFHPTTWRRWAGKVGNACKSLFKSRRHGTFSQANDCEGETIAIKNHLKYTVRSWMVTACCRGSQHLRDQQG